MALLAERPMYGARLKGRWLDHIESRLAREARLPLVSDAATSGRAGAAGESARTSG